MHITSTAKDSDY